MLLLMKYSKDGVNYVIFQIIVHAVLSVLVILKFRCCLKFLFTCWGGGGVVSLTLGLVNRGATC